MSTNLYISKQNLSYILPAHLHFLDILHKQALEIILLTYLYNSFPSPHRG